MVRTAINSTRVDMVIPPLDEWTKLFTDWTTAAMAILARSQKTAKKGRGRPKAKRPRRGKGAGK